MSDKATVEELQKTNRLIGEFGEKWGPRYDEFIEKQKASDTKIAELEAAVKERDKDVQRLLEATPKGRMRDGLADAFERHDADRELQRKQVMFLLTHSPRKGMFDEQEAKDLQIGIGAAGGFTIPKLIQNEIIVKGSWRSIMLANADILVVDALAGTALREEGDFNWYTVPELTEVTATPLTDWLKELSWALVKKQASTVISNDLLQFSSVDIVGRLTDKAGRSYGAKADDWYIAGTGSGNPLGLRYVQGVHTVAQVGDDNMDWTELIGLEGALPAYHRNDAVFVFNDGFRKGLVLIEDTTGRPLFESAVELKKLGIDSDYKNQTGQLRLPGRSYPYFLCSNTAIPSTYGATSDRTEAHFFVPKAYRVISHTEMEMAQDSFGANFDKDQTKIKFTVRTYGLGLNGDAMARLTNAKPAS